MMAFECELMVRVGDVNYGGHLGNDRLVGLLHEARCLFLKEKGCSEIDVLDVGLILKQLQVDYKNESFLHDCLKISIQITDVKAAQFKLLYTVKREKTLIAKATTQMVAYDYSLKKIARLPASFDEVFQQWII